MPALAAVVAASTSAPPSAATSATPRHVLRPSQFLVPPFVVSFAANRYKYGPHKTSNSTTVVCGSKLPDLSISSASYGCRQLHALSLKEKQFFGHKDAPSSGISKFSREQRFLNPPRAYKESFFSFRLPIQTEKPEWWMRTLACVPYLIALKMSDAGYYIQPLLERYNYYLGDLIYFVPGAVNRLPTWFSMVYLYIGYLWIVKNKEFPHFIRFHMMMGMLLETALQIVWYASNFFPLIHYNGKLGMYYWAGVGFAYILVVLQCVRCVLAGGYARLPFISDAANIHTMFSIGGFQRPW